VPRDLRWRHAGASQRNELVAQIAGTSLDVGTALQHIEKRLAVALELARTDAADPSHVGKRARAATQHFQ